MLLFTQVLESVNLINNLMQGGSKAKRGGNRDSSERQQQPSTSAQSFEVGSYVMAWWRNRYEYLAEVLSFRHRHRHQPEYRIRYCWDGVIEWTPASTIRQARKAEIDHVLSYIRTANQHDSSKKPILENAKKSPVPQSSGDVSVTKGDMLYDRSVVQFHEACRKRRELKKRVASGDLEDKRPEKQIKLESSTNSPPITSETIKPRMSTPTNRANSSVRSL